MAVRVLILLGALSWWWKRRKRRARFGFGDEEWHASAPGPGSRRASDSSQKRMLEQVHVESTGHEKGVYGTDSEGNKLLSPPERIGEPRSTVESSEGVEPRKRERESSADGVVEVLLEGRAYESVFIPSLQR